MRRFFSPRTIGITVGVLAILIGSRLLFPVALPTIQLPAEKIPGLVIAGLPITNTIVATLLTDITIFVLIILATRKMEMVPRGMQNLIEWVVEFFHNLAVDIAGSNASRFFPIAMTIFLFLLIANWWELVPGVDSIGIVEHPHAEGMRAYEINQAGPVAILTPELVEDSHEGYVLVPFVRAAATDLNVPLALAIVTMAYVQIAGLRTLKGGYLKKFFNFSNGIDAFVGILELFSEFAKVISLTFRLFGNIFAGQVLLFVIPFLIPWLVVLPFFGLELFVGTLQAYVFGMLALIFLSMAVVSHEGGEHETAGDEATEVSH